MKPDWMKTGNEWLIEAKIVLRGSSVTQVT
jgi:hypothetical protein